MPAPDRTPIGFELDPSLDSSLIADLLELWTDVANAGGAVGFVPPVTPEDVAEIARRAFADATAGASHIVVARSGATPVGFTFLERRPGPLFRHWATLKRLQVHPTRQGDGIGSGLLEAVHGFARKLGFEQIHLTVRGETGIERFYERFGHEIAARIPGVIRLAPDRDVEEIYMIKQL